MSNGDDPGIWDDAGDYGDGEHHEEWVRLGDREWLIRHTGSDGTACVLWATEEPGGYYRIGGMT